MTQVAQVASLDPEILKRERSLSFMDRVYWAYYVHLPFYLMTSGEAFVLRVYLPASTLSLVARIYYYATGDDLLRSIRSHLPYVSKQYLSYIDFSWFNITRYIENMIN